VCQKQFSVQWGDPDDICRSCFDKAASEIKYILDKKYDNEILILLANAKEKIKGEYQKLLDAVINLETAIEYLQEPYLSSDLIKSVQDKAKVFVAEIENSKVCWDYIKEIPSMNDILFAELVNALQQRAGLLILQVQPNNIPQWFEDLLKNISIVPQVHYPVLLKKIDQILEFLNGNQSSCEEHARTYESG